MKRIIGVLLVLMFLFPATALADLRRGDRGEEVRELQQMLWDTGFIFEEPDGVFGGNTEKAVKWFQEYALLKQTGVVDDRTIDSLYACWLRIMEENGYTVLQVRLDDGVRTAAVGVMPAVAAGERVTLTGEWTEHAQYGKQIRVTMCEMKRPQSVSGVERYLASGLIKGIGPSTAKNIVRRFGADALDVLQYAPERLTEIEGIVNSGTKLDISYYIEQVIDEDKSNDIYLYFKEDAQSDSLDEAIEELGGDYTEEEIRLVRIKFMCEQGN